MAGTLATVQRVTEQGSWEMVGRPPHPALGGQVLRYSGYRERSLAPVRRLEAPWAGIVVILSFGDALQVDDAAGGRPSVVSFVPRLSDGPTYPEYAGAQHGIQIDLAPPAAALRPS